MRRSLHDRIERLEIAASAVTPLSEMTDEELDARIRQGAANLNFDTGDELDAQIRRLAEELNVELGTVEMDVAGEDDHERN